MMALTPKRSSFGLRKSRKYFKSVKNEVTHERNSALCSEKEITIGEKSPVSRIKNIDVKTPIRNPTQDPQYHNLFTSPILYDKSPELQVCWNDGGCNPETDTTSPVMVGVPRKRTRRCPEYILRRNAKSMPVSTITADKDDNNVDNYLEWVNNMLESSTTHEKECDPKTNTVKDDILNKDDNELLLDDSSNDIIFHCTQEAEERLLARDTDRLEHDVNFNTMSYSDKCSLMAMERPIQCVNSDSSCGTTRLIFSEADSSKSGCSMVKFKSFPGTSMATQKAPEFTSTANVAQKKINLTTATSKEIVSSGTVNTNKSHQRKPDDIVTNGCKISSDKNVVKSSATQKKPESLRSKSDTSDFRVSGLGKNGNDQRDFSNAANCSGKKMIDKNKQVKINKVRKTSWKLRKQVILTRVRFIRKGSQRSPNELFEEGNEVFEMLDFNYLDSLEEDKKKSGAEKTGPPPLVAAATTTTMTSTASKKIYSAAEIEKRRLEAQRKLQLKYRNKTS